MERLDSFYVIPAYTFFYWGFTFPKKFNRDYVDYFGLKSGHLVESITILINGKKYPAKLRLARIDNSAKFSTRSDNKWRERNVVQVFYEREYDTLKALRKLFIYSYATTISKSKPKLKEILEFKHLKENHFHIKSISKQETDFDEMFEFMEEKNLFKFWKDKNIGKAKPINKIILDYSRDWLSVNELLKYKSRNNIIYLLFHSSDSHLYVGKANNLGERVKAKKGRIGLNSDWDKFMWFEINPEYKEFLEELEHFLIRIFSSLIENNFGIKPPIKSKIKLVNRQLKKNKI